MLKCNTNSKKSVENIYWTTYNCNAHTNLILKMGYHLVQPNMFRYHKSAWQKQIWVLVQLICHNILPTTWQQPYCVHRNTCHMKSIYVATDTVDVEISCHPVHIVVIYSKATVLGWNCHVKIQDNSKSVENTEQPVMWQLTHWPHIKKWVAM